MPPCGNVDILSRSWMFHTATTYTDTILISSTGSRNYGRTIIISAAGGANLISAALDEAVCGGVNGSSNVLGGKNMRLNGGMDASGTLNFRHGRSCEIASSPCPSISSVG